ncbi:MAG: hypothetical protein IJU69_07715, partial [Bacteroidales bacterium]|nr:hypothetical protein [Bacteroidales bacterium]
WSSGGSISNCTISGNGAVNGGGIGISSNVTVTSCNIYGNTASGNGGGVSGYGSGKLSNCTVYGNTAGGYGGGVYWSAGETINANIIEGGTIGGTSLDAGQRNYATSHGGGVYIAASAVQAKVSGATIKYNQSAATCGGIYTANGSAATITGCTIDHNKGGGTTWGGGVYCYGGTVTSTTISYNDAGAGGGIYGNGATLTSLTVNNNTASRAWDDAYPTQSSGGGMYCNNCTISGTMKVYSNTANGRGGGAYLISGTTWSGSSSTDIYSNTANATYGASAFQDGGGGLWIASGVTVHGSSATSLMKIRSNTATGYGGGASVLGKLYYAEVYSNKATRGGGLLLYATASRNIFNGGGKTQNGFCYNSCIRSNTASGIGGGVYMYGSSYMCLNLIIRNTSSSTGNTGFGVYEYSGATSANTAPMVINCSVIHNTRSSSDITPGTYSAGIYINNTSDSGVGYLYNTVSRYGYSNKDIYTNGNCTKGSIYGCHYRTLTRAASTTPAIAYNITNTTAEADLFATTTSTSTSYLVKTSALYSANFNSESSSIDVSTYFPITKDYYGTSISGTIYTIGCEVKFKTP